VEVARIINECHDEAKRLLQQRRKELDALVAELMKNESLDEHEILKVTGLPRAPLLPDRPVLAGRAESILTK
jgi:cell division protease FtsH